jgi:hypothetical protein
MVSGWALVGNIVFAPRRQIKPQRGHEDLVHSKAVKATKDRILTEANEGLFILRVLGADSLRYFRCLL